MKNVSGTQGKSFNLYNLYKLNLYKLNITHISLLAMNYIFYTS
jgi:hypothetical protein